MEIFEDQQKGSAFRYAFHRRGDYLGETLGRNKRK